MISIEVRSEKDVKKGMTDAPFWAGYLKDKEEEIDVFGSPPKGFRKKGGEGSGHHGHSGLSGVWGGSTPSGGSSEETLSPEDIAAQEHRAAEKRKQEELLKAMENTQLLDEYHNPIGEYAESAILEFTDLEPEDFKYMFSLPGTKTEIVFDEIEAEGVLMTIHWNDLETDEIVGRAVRELKHYDGACHNHSLKLEKGWQDRDLAASLYAKQKKLLTEWSYDEIHLEANVTIGRYAWAKEGFKYSDPGRSASSRASLKMWLTQRGMGDLTRQYANEIKHLVDPYDFATFDIPGVTVKGGQIKNIAVDPDYEMHIGKAFMLDQDYHTHNHGSWHGRYEL